MRFLAAAMLVSSVLADVPIPYTNCGKSGDLVTINNVTANVWPPAKGKVFTVNADANLSKDILGGSYHLKVSFDFLPIVDKSGPYTDLNVTLPIRAGPVKISKSVTFPSSVPSGYADIHVSGTDESGHEALCLEIQANLGEKEKEPVKPIIIDYMPGLANTNVEFKNCGDDSDEVTVSSLSADIWPPVKGKDVTLFINAVAKNTVTSGNFEATVAWDGIPLVDQKGSLADLGISLPVAAGPVVAKKTFNVPSLAPSGTIDIKATAVDGNSGKLFCVTVNTQI